MSRLSLGSPELPRAVRRHYAWDADDVSLHVAECDANMVVFVDYDRILVDWGQLGRGLVISQ